MLGQPLTERRAALERVASELGRAHRVRLTPFTRDRDEARRWLDVAQGAKRVDAAYASGKRDMLKLKRLRSADCVVGGFRYAKGTRQVGSFLLGLYDEHGKLDHVGFTSAIANADREALTIKL